MERLILASASPRRRELLARLGVAFEVRPADIDEKVPPGESAADAAVRLAREKAAARAAGGGLILGADTIVSLRGRLLGQPADARAAAEMLAQLAGAEHEVVTAVALVGAGVGDSAVAITRVWFRPIEAAEIARYAGGAEPLGAAGGYAVQGGAAPFVTRVLGSYSNVVGLPLSETARLLAAAGVPLGAGESA